MAYNREDGGDSGNYQDFLMKQQTQNTGVNGNNVPQATTNSNNQPATGGYQAPDWTNRANWTADNINTYARSKGVTDPNFANYWVGKGDELYQRGQEIGDPNYAGMRLSMADEFGGPRYGGGGGGAAGGGAYVPGQGVPGMGTVFGGGGTTGSAAGNSLYDFLMSRAKQSLTPDPNDPVIAAQTNAFSAQADRAAKNQMTMAAEKGGPLGNTDATNRSALEHAAQSTAGYQGQLLGNEVAARRNEIQNALSGAQGLLTDTQRMQLQEELAQLQLGQGAYQFDTNMQFMNSPLYGG
jgi:hypothetical protein